MNGKTVYLTDGTSDGFYTAVFEAYKDDNALLTSERYRQSSIGERTVRVVPDLGKATRVVSKIKSIDGNAAYDIELVLRSREADKEQTAFLYIRELYRNNHQVPKHP